MAYGALECIPKDAFQAKRNFASFGERHNFTQLVLNASNLLEQYVEFVLSPFFLTGSEIFIV